MLILLTNFSTFLITFFNKKKLLSASIDCPVKIWNFDGQFNQNEENYLLEDNDYHTTAISTATTNESLIVTGDAGGEIKLFDLRLLVKKK